MRSFPHWFAVSVLAATLGCRDGARAPEPSPRAAPAAAVFDAARAPADAAIPATLPAALESLRARGLAVAADEIAARAAQPGAKMKLSEEDAMACARYLLAVDSEAIVALHEVMPRSTVELVRAVHERGVSPEEADRIAEFLVQYVADKRFGRLDSFDRNHSHVTGREFRDIDYSGERMTWQGQHDYWSARGVPDFKTAAHIRAYMTQAEKMPHFERVYRPR